MYTNITDFTTILELIMSLASELLNVPIDHSDATSDILLGTIPFQERRADKVNKLGRRLGIQVLIKRYVEQGKQP